MSQHLSPAEIISLYRTLEKQAGYDPVAPRDEALLELICARPHIGAYPDVLAEIASLIEGLINSRPFVTLNTATAFAVMHITLELNNYTLGCSPTSANNTWNQWAKEFVNWPEIHKWLSLVAEPA